MGGGIFTGHPHAHIAPSTVASEHSTATGSSIGRATINIGPVQVSEAIQHFLEGVTNVPVDNRTAVVSEVAGTMAPIPRSYDEDHLELTGPSWDEMNPDQRSWGQRMMDESIAGRAFPEVAVQRGGIQYQRSTLSPSCTDECSQWGDGDVLHVEMADLSGGDRLSVEYKIRPRPEMSPALIHENLRRQLRRSVAATEQILNTTADPT